MKPIIRIALVLACLFQFSTVRAASFVSVASGNWTSPTTWSVTGADADGIPDTNDDVTIASGTSVVLDVSIVDCLSLLVDVGGTLNSTSDILRVRGGNFTRNGTLNGTITLYFFPPGGIISCNTTFANNGNWYFQAGCNYTIASGTLLSKQNYFYLQSTANVTNNGSVRLYGGSLSLSGSSNWTNGTNASLSVARPFVGSGTLNSAAVGSTVLYNTSQANPIRITANTTYHNLSVIGSGVRAMTSDLVVGGTLSITTGATLNAAGFDITVGGNWSNTANTNVTNLATVTFNGSDLQTISRSTTPEVFNNVDISCADTLRLLSNIIVNGTTNLINGMLDPGNFNYQQRGVNWNGEGGFVTTNGRVVFNGTSAQTIGGSAFTNFGNLEINNTNGVSNTTNNRMRGTLFLTSGVFSATAGDFIFVSDATQTARIDQLIAGGGGLNGTRFVCQRFIGVNAPSTTTPYWSYFASPVTSSTILDWDNEMYMSGVGGADGNACCPIFRSVRRYSGSVYTNVLSTSTALTVGGGYMVWTADNLGVFNGLLFDTRGLPTTGDRTINVPSGFTLIGNPFMSQIQWSLMTRSNVNNFFYIVDESISNYATWNGASLTGTAKLASSGGVINSSQGILVQATAAGNVSIPEVAKTTGTAVFVRQAADNALVRLQLRRSDGQPLGAENIVNFGTEYADESDDTDIPALLSPNENAPYMRTFTAAGNELFFDNRSLNTASQAIPLVIAPGMAGDFVLRFGNMDQFSAYSCAYLEDVQTGQFINMRTAESYTFHAEDGITEKQFVLHFDQEEIIRPGLSACRYLLQDAPVAETTIPVNAFATTDGLVVTFGYETATTVLVTLYNSLGQEVYREQLNVSSEQVKLPLNAQATGIYILRVQEGDREVSQKVKY